MSCSCGAFGVCIVSDPLQVLPPDFNRAEFLQALGGEGLPGSRSIATIRQPLKNENHTHYSVIQFIKG